MLSLHPLFLILDCLYKLIGNELTALIGVDYLRDPMLNISLLQDVGGVTGNFLKEKINRFYLS